MNVPQPRRPLFPLIPALVVVFVAALDLTVIAPILPPILFDLQINTAEADRYVWIVSGYLLAYTVTIPLMGRASDFIGRQAAFLAAVGVFVLGSAICATANTLPGIIAGRVVQGLGGGAMVPVAMALVGDLRPPHQRAGALGIVAAVDTLGWVLGPLWGALIHEITGSWRAIFVLNVPIGVLAGGIVVLAWVGIPTSTAPLKRLDLLGAALLTTGLLCLNLAVSSLGESPGAAGPRPLGAAHNPLSEFQIPLLLAAVLSLLLLVPVEWRAPNPLIPLQLFRKRSFSAANGANVLVGGALMVAMVNVPLLVTLVVDEQRSSFVTGGLLSALSIAMALGALAGGWLSERLGYRMTTWIGLLIAALGFWRMTGWPDTIHLTPMMGDLAVTGAGFGLVIAPVGAAAINAANREHLGIASALVIVMRLLGMTLGVSAITAWSVGQLNEQLASLPPVAQRAGESLTEYLARQQRIAVDQAIPVTLEIVRDTFGIAAILCLVALIPAALVYGQSRRRTERSTQR